MKQNIKLVIFDLDGTLIDAYEAIEESVNYTMMRLGLSKQPSLNIRRAVGWGDEALLRPFVGEKNLNTALRIYRKSHRATLPKKSHLLNGTLRVLNYLHRNGYKLAIASNRPYEFSQILLKNLKISHFFDYVLCADQIKKGKPYPDILLKIIKKLNCTNKQTFYVGDMAIDIQAGKNAKVKTVAILGGSSTKKEIVKLKPDYLIKNIFELINIFK